MVFNPARPSRGYQLLWPREIFSDELAAITELLGDRDVRPALRWLFEEALRGPDPIEDLDRVPTALGRDLNGWPMESANPVRDFGRLIYKHRDVLPDYTPRRYYLARHEPTEPEAAPAAGDVDWLKLQQAWSALVENLVANGYLDRLAGDSCSDGQGADVQAARISVLIRDHCGLVGQWPLTLVEDGLATDEDVFFTLVEVFHDLVARPRVRMWHDFDQAFCWSSEFDEHAGQAVYRFAANELLNRCGVEYQLADSGEDQGLLVHAPADGRATLVLRLARSVENSQRLGDPVTHAIKLFRSRDTSVEDKRSACIALAGVLEARRDLLKTELLTKDEGALFNIANNFAVRHQDASQQRDYDEAYLDWIFWWYLATVELTNRLIARNETASE